MATLSRINQLHKNPSTMNDGYSFEIYINVQEQLQEDIDIKIIYVGSSYSRDYDQILEDISVGPLNIGLNKFTITTEPVDFSPIPESELLGNTLLLISCMYREKEFCRVGYYVNNELEGIDPLVDEIKRENIDMTKVVRTLSEPRVTLFPCFWDKEEVIQMEEEKNGENENENVLAFDADGNIEGNVNMIENPNGLNDNLKDEIRSALGVNNLMNENDVTMEEEDIVEDDEEQPMNQ